MNRATTDRLRIYAAIAVMMIHSTARDERLFHERLDLFSGEFLGATINQLARFCVPIFILLSGYGLSRSYEKWADKPLKEFPFSEFLKARFKKIIAPYLVLTFIFLLAKGYFLNQPFLAYPLIFLKALLYGNSEYHLYFLSIITQCYLLFPVFLGRKSIWSLLALFTIHLTLVYPFAGWLYLDSGLLSEMPSTSYFFYWIFYFYLGIFYAHHRQRIHSWISQLTFFAPILFTLSFAGVMVEYIWRAHASPNCDYYNHFNRVTITFYTISILMLTIAFAGGREKEHGNEGKLKITGIMSAITFPVYLYHTTLLRILNLTFLEKHTLAMGALLSISMFTIIYLVWKYMPAMPRLRMWLGVPDLQK